MTLQFFRPIQALIILSVFVGFILSGNTAKAQALPCGSIIGLENTTEITSCDNPFEAEAGTPFEFIVEGIMVNDGETVFVEGSSTNNYLVTNTPFYAGHFEKMYKHDGNDYREVNIEELPITREDYNRYAIEFFGETNASTELYIDRLMGQPVDTNSPDWNRGDYIAFADYVEANHVPVRPALEASTYTLVVEENVIYSTQADKTWFDAIREVFIKTAHAQFSHGPRYVLTFIIAETIPEPTGASSVLFLPGIQASRLYSFEDGEENQLWEPNANTDVNDLRMNVSGGSINDIYTRDVVDEVAIPIFGGNIYKGFLGMLEDLVDSETINDYEAFAYDWRYAVDDIVTYGTRYEHEIRNVVTAVERLAEDSYSGKVTVIGHSNGGLVTKMLIKELERQGKANLVDKVVFIATPHLGTPKAIATVLHGYDQQKLGGAVIDDSLARAIIQNMPGVYGLLPSQRYLELASESIITISEGVSTQPMYEAFDGEIEGVTEYRNFLNGVEGRTDDFADISNPYRTNPYMLQGALDLHAELDYWEAPEGIEVFNLVGVGLPTVSKVEYRNVTEIKNCVSTLFGQIICDTVHFLRPYAHFTQYGDETVTSLSSELVEGETFYFNFEDYRAENILFSGQVHANITEVEGVRDYIEEIIVDGHPSLTTYIFENSPNFSREYEVTSIDSPVRIIKEDSLGNKTGVVIQDGVAEIVKEIPGSEYVEFGGTKYVIVPKDEDMTTYLYGEDHGSYTLTTATLSGDEQVTDTQIINATTTPTTVAQYEFVDGAYSTILTDYDGDGTTDLEMTVSGEVISEPEITFDSLRTQILDLGLSKPRVKPLLILVNLAEKAQKLKVHSKISKRISDRLLMQLRDTIKLYAKKGWITQERSEILKSTIDKLISK